MTTKTEVPEVVVPIQSVTDRMVAEAIAAGCTVYQRGKRYVAITAEGKPLFLGGSALEDERTWDAMRQIGIALDEV